MHTETQAMTAAGWIARLGEDLELTQEERAALADFMRDSPAHVRELIFHAFIRDDVRSMRLSQQQLDRWIVEARTADSTAVPFPDAQVADWPGGRFADGGAEFPLAAPFAKRLRMLFGSKQLAALMLAAAIGFGGWFAHTRAGLYTTALGEQRTLTLADGSVVTLNTESRMKVDFTDRRRIINLLQGEAFFRVAHDGDRPFLVSVDNAVVQSLGTQFNVRLARRDTVVSLIDGVVSVSLSASARREGSAWPAAIQRGANESDTARNGAGDAAHKRDRMVQVTLNVGEEARVGRTQVAGDDSAVVVNKIAMPAALRAVAWTRGRLEFDDTPLAEVLSEFQRYQPLKIEFDNDRTRQVKLTGSFESHDPESVLAYIATIPSMKVDKYGPRSYFIHRS